MHIIQYYTNVVYTLYVKLQQRHSFYLGGKFRFNCNSYKLGKHMHVSSSEQFDCPNYRCPQLVRIIGAVTYSIIVCTKSKDSLIVTLCIFRQFVEPATNLPLQKRRRFSTNKNYLVECFNLRIGEAMLKWTTQVFCLEWIWIRNKAVTSADNPAEIKRCICMLRRFQFLTLQGISSILLTIVPW